MFKIYVLVDPVDMGVRYVGCTRGKLDRRMIQHLTKPVNDRMGEWLGGLRLRGLKPLGWILMEVEDRWLEEAKWISKFIGLGCDILNKSDRHYGYYLPKSGTVLYQPGYEARMRLLHPEAPVTVGGHCDRTTGQGKRRGGMGVIG